MDSPPTTPVFSQLINPHCPRSGKAVVADSLAVYRGQTVGFCNPGCRDDFLAGGEKRAQDEVYFDAAIAALK